MSRRNGTRRAPILIVVIALLVAGAFAGRAHQPAAPKTATRGRCRTTRGITGALDRVVLPGPAAVVSQREPDGHAVEPRRHRRERSRDDPPRQRR